MNQTTHSQESLPIRLFVLDVDGVLTDGRVWYSDTGDLIQAFHIHDGLGLKRLREAGTEVAVISGRKSQAVAHRMEELKIDHVFQGVSDKLPVFYELLKTFGLERRQAACIGDDLPDVPIMQASGIAIAVSSAVPAVKQVAHYCTHLPGGRGAVREACEWIQQLERTE